MKTIRDSQNFRIVITLFGVGMLLLEKYELTNVNFAAVLMLGAIMLGIVIYAKNNVVSRILGFIISLFYLFSSITNISSFGLPVLIDGMIGLVLFVVFGYQLYQQYQNSDIMQAKGE